MNGEEGWFADWDRDATTAYGWQPCLETGEGHIPCFEVWFDSKAACEQWIEKYVIGVGWLPGEPSYRAGSAIEGTNG